jgi:hypothetical protein
MASSGALLAYLCLCYALFQVSLVNGVLPPYPAVKVTSALKFPTTKPLYYFPKSAFQTSLCTATSSGSQLIFDKAGTSLQVTYINVVSLGSTTTYTVDLTTGFLYVTGYALSVGIDLKQLSVRNVTPAIQLNDLSFATRAQAVTALNIIATQALKYKAPNTLVPCYPAQANYAPQVTYLSDYLNLIKSAIAKP